MTIGNAQVRDGLAKAAIDKQSMFEIGMFNANGSQKNLIQGNVFDFDDEPPETKIAK